MAYSRREVYDHRTVMNKDLYDNLQDGIDESKEGLKDLTERVDHLSGSMNTICVGDTEPTGNSWIWFQVKSTDVQETSELLLTLSDDLNAGDVQVEIDNTDYGVEDSTTNEEAVDEKSLLFKIL